MSFHPGLLPRLLPHPPLSLFRPSARFTHSTASRSSSFSSFRSRLGQSRPDTIAISIPRTLPRASKSHLYALGLGLTFWTYSSLSPSRSVQCESSISGIKPSAQGRADSLPDPKSPQSILSVQELGFGAVAGICAGVFLKKGLRALAFLLGGAFVFLQYLSSRSIVNVDWAKLSSKYDETFGTRTASGVKRSPTVSGVYNWIVDFLTANFQQRASFLAGFVLGIRLG